MIATSYPVSYTHLGKTVLAVDVVKAIQRERRIKQGKVAIVTGDSLNKKKLSDIFQKLYGGALIIEKAGKMNERTVAKLNKAMEGDTGEMLIVLEEQRKPLDRLLSSNREFRRKFTSRLEVPIFINDELVTFGQTYARENGYKIDEMGILALYLSLIHISCGNSGTPGTIHTFTEQNRSSGADGGGKDPGSDNGGGVHTAVLAAVGNHMHGD